jgi:two-component system cell cycle sensor histidine kinase/response regulator CckA
LTVRNTTSTDEPSGTGSLESIGRVFGELAHDLASELLVLQGWAQLARGESEAGRPAVAELERVVELSESIGAMLRDLLSATEGRPVSPEIAFAPTEVTEAVLAQRVRELSSLTVRLRMEVPAEAQVRGFASFWARIITNLLSNAARHARTEVLISLRVERNQLILMVEDDGPGVAADVADRVFDPLWTGDRGRMGLGLSSVAWLVDRLGGGARLAEPSELTGAAFEVRVPLAAGIGSRGPGSGAREVIGGRRILLIDDDAAVRRALQRLLTRLGGEVRELDPAAGPDDEVLDSLIAALPDVVMLDLRMGRRGGISLWQSLVGQVPGLGKRAIFMTGGSPGDPDWDEATATGQPVLGKPFTLEQLAEAIGRLG